MNSSTLCYVLMKCLTSGHGHLERSHTWAGLPLWIFFCDGQLWQGLGSSQAWIWLWPTCPHGRGWKGVTGDSLPVLLSFIVLAMSPSCQIYSVFKPDVLQFGGNLKDHAFQPPHFDCTWLLDTPEGFSPFLLSWDWDSAWVEERWFLCHIYRALFLHTFSPKPIMELPHLDT